MVGDKDKVKDIKEDDKEIPSFNGSVTYNSYLLNKLVNIIIIIAVLWFSSVIVISGGFLWYISQYDYTNTTSTITTDINQDTENGNNSVETSGGGN